MSLVTEDTNYYCEVLFFDLKIAGVTYQRIMVKVLFDVIRHNVKVYIDNMVIKSCFLAQHAKNLTDKFSTLKMSFET